MIRFKRIVYFHYKICQYYQTSDTIFKYIEITHRHCFAVLRRVHYNLLVVCWNVHTAGDHVSRVVREQRSCGRGIRYSSDAVSNFAALSLFNLLSMSDSWCRIRLFIFYSLSATSVRLKLSKIRNTNRSIEETLNWNCDSKFHKNFALCFRMCIQSIPTNHIHESSCETRLRYGFNIFLNS